MIQREVSPSEFRAAALASAPHYLPLLDAVDAGVLLIAMSPAGRLSAPAERVGRRSWVFVVSDDCPERKSSNNGPSAFDRASIEWVMRNASHVAVYSGKADVSNYATFALAALCGGCVAVIETTVQNHAAWAALVRRAASRASIIELTPLNGAPAGRA